MRVTISEYQPDWAKRFSLTGAQLREVFGHRADRIDHIGSTAVPGLAAKPVIDVQVSLPDLGDMERLRDAVCESVLRVDG